MLRRVKGFIYATPTLERDPKLVLVAKGMAAGANETTTKTVQAKDAQGDIGSVLSTMSVHTPCMCITGTVLVPALVAFALLLARLNTTVSHAGITPEFSPPRPSCCVSVCYWEYVKKS